MRQRLVVAVLGLLWSLPSVAASEGDWFASLYTGDGVELRADERVFTLFAVFNALGFDAGPVTRREPIAKTVFHPVRQTVRARVMGGSPEVRAAADAFFDAHPLPLRQYLAYALASSPPPFSAGPKAKELADLKGFEQVLAKAWVGWRLDELMAQVQQEYRRASKGYLSGLDVPLARARASLKVTDASGPQTLVVLNLLDAQDAVRGVLSEGAVVLVVGPGEKPNFEGALREYARVVLEPSVSPKAAQWAGGAALLHEAQLAGAGEQTVAAYGVALLTHALALKSLEASDAAWEAEQNRGYFGIKELAKLFDEGKPVDAWALEAWAKAEQRRPTKK